MVLTNAMYATLSSLIAEGIVSEKQVSDYANSHICIPVWSEDAIWFKIKKFFGWSMPKDTMRVIVLKVSEPLPTPSSITPEEPVQEV